MKNKQNNVTATVNPVTLTRSYVIPDLANLPLEEIKLPTIDELSFLGKENLKRVRTKMRKYERMLDKRMTPLTDSEELLKTSIKDMQEYVSLNEIEREKLGIRKIVKGRDRRVMCDWRGFGNANIEANNVFSCRYGRGAAAACKMNPCNYFDKVQQFGAIYAMGVESKMDGRICETYPFSDQECVLIHGTNNELEKCREAIAELKQEERARMTLARRYVDLLTKAIDMAPDKPLFAEWREIESWAKTDDRLATIQNDLLGDNPVFVTGRVLCTNLKDLLPQTYEEFSEQLLVDFVGGVSSYGVCSPKIFKQEEIDFLKENDDFLELWMYWATDQFMEPVEEVQPMMVEQFRKAVDDFSWNADNRILYEFISDICRDAVQQ